MYCGQDWDPLDVAETDVFSLNFINDLNVGETILSVSFSIGVTCGNDPSPASRLMGSPGILGTIVSQTVAHPVEGVTYWLAALATTSAGRQIELWAHFPSVMPM
jgi:hypothetical protein